MVKIISILLILLYTSVQGIGMSFNVHYCDDKITEINIFNVEADCCCAGFNEFSYSCCDDEQVYAKGDTEHAAANTLTLDKNKKEQVVTITSCLPKLTCPSCSLYSQKFHNNSPPFSQQHSWLLFNTFRL